MGTIGKNDRVGDSVKSYISYLNRISKYLNIIIAIFRSFALNLFQINNNNNKGKKLPTGDVNMADQIFPLQKL
jgi:hypothetical protein